MSNIFNIIKIFLNFIFRSFFEKRLELAIEMSDYEHCNLLPTLSKAGRQISRQADRQAGGRLNKQRATSDNQNVTSKKQQVTNNSNEKQVTRAKQQVTRIKQQTTSHKYKMTTSKRHVTNNKYQSRRNKQQVSNKQ